MIKKTIYMSILLLVSSIFFACWGMHNIDISINMHRIDGWEIDLNMFKQPSTKIDVYLRGVFLCVLALCMFLVSYFLLLVNFVR